MDSGSTTSRRKFLTTSLASLAAAGLPSLFSQRAAALKGGSAPVARPHGPNDQINVGIIGLGGSRGGNREGLAVAVTIANIPGCKIVAACDVDAVHLNEGLQYFGSECNGYKDFRELLAREDIDAVAVATPDHWHAPISIAAMHAGKDVYCEKPLTLAIEEGRNIVQVAQKTKRVFQVGSQQRSSEIFQLACELVRNGRLGKLKRVETHLPLGKTGGPFEVKPVPTDFDWDMWLGPARFTEYIPERTHGTFRWWLEYSGGMMTDWGAHHNDIAQWALGTDNSGPVSVEAVGKGVNPEKNSYSTFSEFSVTYTYADGTPLICTNKGENGVLFDGEDGWIFVSRTRINASDGRLISDPLPSNAVELFNPGSHTGNFIDCVRSRKRCICDAEIGHRSATVCHLGNISLRLGGRKLHWDPVRERFVGDQEADMFLSRSMRQPWSI
jgi:predicted dehydrogenase